jgi:hypothetical protein
MFQSRRIFPTIIFFFAFDHDTFVGIRFAFIKRKLFPGDAIKFFVSYEMKKLCGTNCGTCLKVRHNRFK